jgi:hypothetical protein
MDETVVHAYGIVAENEPLTEFPPGIAEMRVRVFDARGLGAIVSLLPAEGFGAVDWEKNAANLGWLGQRPRCEPGHSWVKQIRRITSLFWVSFY